MKEGHREILAIRSNGAPGLCVQESSENVKFSPGGKMFDVKVGTVEEAGLCGMVR